ncbi:hypothetical protein TRFO_04495 [Tritrichomonas foetus]|uniref:Uncharacterized protein n=1 Tax=Tritrichomonas foetus TaxID=1144522 RepID=A0A1J4KDC6_9EUKA|nr:hypothetical protein TRFO_04495 [Tritrichomonas foetus]|eukprot:OHT09441.1 hypothetical protein TRFO_04495 [Tritrichomonas foetus]
MHIECHCPNNHIISFVISSFFKMVETLDDQRDPADRYKQFEESINMQLAQVEEELASLTQPQSLSKATQNGSMILPTLSSLNPLSSKGNILAPYWEQVLTCIHQGQDEEAIYALVRVVQRLLDEKAYRRTLYEKASKAYVDNLFERVSTGVNNNMLENTTKSCDSLDDQVIVLSQKIGEVKDYFQKELNEMKKLIAQLNDAEPQSETIIESGRSTETQQSTRPVKTGSSFTVCPPRLNR